MNSAKDTPFRVGCPIRRSRDQRSLASPPGFSQRATSFIASQCQGIHQMPFIRASRATPNGKNHPVIRHRSRRNCVPPVAAGETDALGETAFRLSRGGTAFHPGFAGANSPLRRHYGIPPTTHQANTPLWPPAVSRLGHTTRFFTIVHQHRAPASPKGQAGGKFSASCRVFRDRVPDTGLSTIRFAFQRLLRKRLPAR
jgi:hypothetical protein